MLHDMQLASLNRAKTPLYRSILCLLSHRNGHILYNICAISHMNSILNCLLLPTFVYLFGNARGRHIHIFNNLRTCHGFSLGNPRSGIRAERTKCNAEFHKTELSSTESTDSISNFFTFLTKAFKSLHQSPRRADFRSLEYLCKGGTPTLHIKPFRCSNLHSSFFWRHCISLHWTTTQPAFFAK